MDLWYYGQWSKPQTVEFEDVSSSLAESPFNFYFFNVLKPFFFITHS